jgi:hypothetical protein
MVPSFQNWTELQKNVFRFFFIFLSTTSLFAYNIFSGILVSIFTKMSYAEAHKAFGVISGPLGWIDRHFFHIGYNDILSKRYIRASSGAFFSIRYYYDSGNQKIKWSGNQWLNML